MNLLIVESPAKVRTIKKFLGRNFAVEACMGHVRDLPKTKLGVDVEDEFEPAYVNIRAKTKIINKLKTRSKKKENIYLGADDDREGEAICWHLKEALGLKNNVHRIRFNEITSGAVKKAINNPGSINVDKLNAQQARRILDRLVGYMVSPVLWKKVMKGLSAGRVQSVAVRLICEREAEIQSFVPQEYWSVNALLESGSGERFYAKLVRTGRKKVELNNSDEANKVGNEIKKAKFVVSRIEHRREHKMPRPPLTTSYLQQEAAAKLGFGAGRTMRIAQQLYEGLDIGKSGTMGLITYMRTDSVRISKDARRSCAGYIKRKYGNDFVPESPRVFKNKKGAQGAHEAIRPTDVKIEPEQLSSFLTADQMKIYKIIWQRFVASQCRKAILQRTKITIKAGRFVLVAGGIKVIFPGFLKIGSQHDTSTDEKKNNGQSKIPNVKEGDILSLIELLKEQHFTKPPPRYSEGTLVKVLEEKGIGRPSTYAPTIATVIARGYVSRNRRQLLPTKLGGIVNNLLVEHMGRYFSVEFTAGMEDKLDRIEAGKAKWKNIIREFYGPFSQSVVKAGNEMQNVKELLIEETDEICEKCGSKMIIRQGRFGRFKACSNFPKCKNTKPVVINTGVSCPESGCDGSIIERRTKRGRVFYGCSKYPECKFSTWDKPSAEKCKKCGGFLVEKSRGGDKILKCTQPECDYEKSYSEVSGVS